MAAHAQETQPGDVCTAGQIHQYLHSAGPENSGTGYTLVCNGSTWKTVSEWSSATGNTLFQVDYDSGGCNADKEGRLRFESSAGNWEYCHSSSWILLSPDESDPKVGTLTNTNYCYSDGSQVLCDRSATQLVSYATDADGSGSGLDADLFDGIDSTSFVQISRDLIAGNGLTGGGTLSTDRTFNVGAGDGISVAADLVALDTVSITACTNSITNKLYWDNTGKRLVCGTDQTGSGSGDYQVFTTNGTWNKPAGVNDHQKIIVEFWGGGGGGVQNSGEGGGGGGGAYRRLELRAGDVASAVSVSVGLGGTPGNNGGNSSFGSYGTAYGGGGADGNCGGGGGGTLSAGLAGGASGDPLGGTNGGSSLFGGGGRRCFSTSAGGYSLYGGGGGGGENGGDSTYGGAGGAGAVTGSGVGGVSLYGGNGGNTSSGRNGSVPGGGGAGALSGTAGSGARGEVRVWVVY